MTEKKKQQKRTPASAGKRIYVKAPPVNRMTDAQIEQWAQKFFAMMCEEYPELGPADKEKDSGTDQEEEQQQ